MTEPPPGEDVEAPVVTLNATYHTDGRFILDLSGREIAWIDDRVDAAFPFQKDIRYRLTGQWTWNDGRRTFHIQNAVIR